MNYYFLYIFVRMITGKPTTTKRTPVHQKVGKKMSGTAVEPLFPVLGKSNVMKSILEKWREGCR